MADSASLLDQAIELGNQELDLLAAGDVEEAQELARNRGRLVNEAWDRRETGAMEVLRDKLTQLQSLQVHLSSQARKLHASVKEELIKARQESARLHGYGKAAKPVPSVHGYSKRG